MFVKSTRFKKVCQLLLSLIIACLRPATLCSKLSGSNRVVHTFIAQQAPGAGEQIQGTCCCIADNWKS